MRFRYNGSRRHIILGLLLARLSCVLPLWAKSVCLVTCIKFIKAFCTLFIFLFVAAAGALLTAASSLPHPASKAPPRDGGHSENGLKV